MIVFLFGSKRYFTYYYDTCTNVVLYFPKFTHLVTILFEFDIELSLGVAKCFEFVTVLWRENTLNFTEQNKPPQQNIKFRVFLLV